MDRKWQKYTGMPNIISSSINFVYESVMRLLSYTLPEVHFKVSFLFLFAFHFQRPNLKTHSVYVVFTEQKRWIP